MSNTSNSAVARNLYSCPRCANSGVFAHGGNTCDYCGFEMPDLIVTRHKALVDFMIEAGFAVPGTPVVSHASPDDLKGRFVAGVLPLHLAEMCEKVLVVNLKLTPDDRGRELSVVRMREIFTGARVYRVEGEVF